MKYYGNNHLKKEDIEEITALSQWALMRIEQNIECFEYFLENEKNFKGRKNDDINPISFLFFFRQTSDEEFKRIVENKDFIQDLIFKVQFIVFKY